MSKEDNSKLYRPCVGIALFNAEGNVFVGERIDAPGSWQMPQGGIDEGESIEEALFREMKEEVGSDNGDLLEIMNNKVRYDFPDTLKHKLFDGKFCGQEQSWAAVRFKGQDSDININYFDPPEFLQWKWVGLDNVLDLIVPFKRSIYIEVIKSFKKYS